MKLCMLKVFGRYYQGGVCLHTHWYPVVKYIYNIYMELHII